MTVAWKPTLPRSKAVGAGSFKKTLLVDLSGGMTLLFALIVCHTASCLPSTAVGRSRIPSMSPWQLYATKPAATLGLLSFDLDDTLFPTSEVVRSANEVMISTMHELGCSDTTIPLFLDNTRTIRKSLTNPITYRDLRKKTIRKTLLESSEFGKSSNGNGGKEQLDILVDECYDAWVNGRHAAAERFVFEDAVETLRNLRETYPDVCIAAITNGAGDPLSMSNTLAPYFDMRISGEDEAVFPHRKPHPYIYEYTLGQYGKSIDEEVVWCHVGDCLANDVGASASCGAQAIWMCSEADEDSAAARLTDTKRVPEWSTASTEELQMRAEQVANGRESVAAKIEKLSELPEAIDRILAAASNSLTVRS